MYALRAGRMFDGHQGHGPSTVLIDEGRIVSVHTDSAPPPGEVTDLGDDVTLLPGLIDTHVHLVFDCTFQAVDHVQQATDDELLAQMRTRARAALTAGVTTMRDLGDRRYLSLQLREELAKQVDAGPMLLCAGPPVTSAKGHCWFLGGEVPAPGSVTPDGHGLVDALRAAVAERVDRGVDAIKVMATGGEMTAGTHSHLTQFSLDELRTVVLEAHRHGLPVAAHAHGIAGVANALAAGVDTIEHCSFMSEDSVVRDEALTAGIAESGIIVSATLGAAIGDFPPPPPAILKRLPLLMDHLRRLVTAGAAITIGTDAGIGPQKPHDVLPYGAVQLAELGLGPVTALTAVTSLAARACWVADRKGALRPGHDADLLVVRGDPLTDIRALHDVVAVYRAGVRVSGARVSQPAPSIAVTLDQMTRAAATEA